ncbi:ATP-dependent helicase [Lederbergia graminis]|uniref:DNA 3'-5' helicase n=1 Tax=Lederbergia graminis TaxID=735518 RepID=A0ABW0LLN6_9BACI
MVDFFRRKEEELGVRLNDVQRQAVLQTEGPLLLLASPGSGKTTTIIMRIGFIIEEKGVDPSNIKAVTFSKASAKDMEERFARFFPQLQPVDFSTIHSFAFQIVREYFYKTRTHFHIIEGTMDADNQHLHKNMILRNLFKSLTGENITEDQMDELTTFISYVKNKMLPPEKWNSVSCDVPKAVQIVTKYEAFKRINPGKLLIDYDDMLTIGNEVLEKDSHILRKYQQKFHYVLTDESQDTSLVQHAIMEKLVKTHGNLCVVADDDQSIYSWRGAEPSYLLDFKKVYPNAVTLFMEQNYRSSKEIVDTANQFIKRNKHRYEKNMFTNNPTAEPIKIIDFQDYNEQSNYLVKEIKDIENLREVAVLFRNNSSSITLMNKFDRAGIPFYMKDADNRFFSHWVVEDILNFMRMSFTDKRPDILEKIHTKFDAYITKQQMEAVKRIANHDSVFDNLLKFVPVQDYQVKKIQLCKKLFQEMNGMTPVRAIKLIREKLGYEKAIDKMCERLGFRKDYLIGILNTLEDIAKHLKTLEEFANRLTYLKNVMQQAKHKKGQNAVTFSTFHSSKGLEFEKVYMIDCVSGVIPSKEDRASGNLMEEATRLFYVGMTRAKKKLELLTYRNRDGNETEVSEFVVHVKNILNPPTKREVEQKVKSGKVPFNPNAIQAKEEITEGKIVKHRVFGTGTIAHVDTDKFTIKFPTKEKTLLIDTCLNMGLIEAVE